MKCFPMVCLRECAGAFMPFSRDCASALFCVDFAKPWLLSTSGLMGFCLRIDFA